MSFRFVRRPALFCITALLFSLLLPLHARAADVDGASKYLEGVGNQAIATISDKKLSKDQKQAKLEKMFSAGIYNGDVRVGSIVHGGGAIGVMPVKDGGGYSQYVSVKDSGGLQVMITNDKDFLEIVEVDGRKTHLANDLDYTKSVRTHMDVVAPVLDKISSKKNSVPPAQSR